MKAVKTETIRFAAAPLRKLHRDHGEVAELLPGETIILERINLKSAKQTLSKVRSLGFGRDLIVRQTHDGKICVSRLKRT